ncbi:DNA methylase [Candidatus Methylobacter favarea]|uniref:DNA methylase n=1 Tax=Candidatus Methylobacter favarea TaxID=2707345 RepID=A0A8S0Y6X2_9GAMM|nr:DNA methyltransferase [Candidatus Methylobacter favarea]CAA9892389.1 DNA methylase [Candidatus Methylobacter favarea]
MSDLYDYQTENSGPVECLGQTFPNEQARRDYFLAELAKKLKDPEFRKIEGFPLGNDEDILKLSDPPYYTACPNPWLAKFIAEWEAQKPEQPADYHYHREPFAADVSEGKNDPIYNAHSYHTKVPHKAIMRYILHYTQPGDLIYDGFCGTGMTGVAAQMCGDRAVVESMGFRILADGTILEEVAEDNKTIWAAHSKLGSRHAILNDLAPAATFISYNYISSVDVLSLKDGAENILPELEKKIGWMWKTSGGSQFGKINYTVWSEVYSCPQCSGEITYYDTAFKKKGASTEYHEVFDCPHCQALCAKSPSKKSGANKLERVWESIIDPFTGNLRKTQKRIPVLINYSIGKKRFEKRVDAKDIDTLNRAKQLNNTSNIPIARMPSGDEARRNDDEGITHVHHFYTERVLASVGEYINLAKNQPQLAFLLGSVLPKLTIMNRYMPQHGGRALVGPMANTLYVPPVSVENNVLDQLSFQLKKIVGALNSKSGPIISTQAMQTVQIPDESVDYIFLDPPFGANIMYSELSYLREAWLKVFTNSQPEAIENKTQGKGIDEYRALMTSCFGEAYRILKPGRWMTVEFSNTKASVWNSIQTALSECGFVVASVAALDKTRGGLHAMLGVTAVKQDLVISAYKPNGGFEERFAQEAQTEEGIWDFVHTHLKYLPIVKRQGSILQNIPERNPRILFDQLIAYYVRRGPPVPISSQEFQAGLKQIFREEDDMIFLENQHAEYIRQKAISGHTPQMNLFVCDESSAIAWLRFRLKSKPQAYNDIQPDFMPLLSHLNKNERDLINLELLLPQNFLCYDGKELVPEQIHVYLSSNWKECRNLSKDDASLKAKAYNRWYVPDPNKAGDLEKLREKALLKEFDNYKEAKKKLKIFRLEAVRAGFKDAWSKKDYQTIINMAQKIPDDVLQEDEKLLLWYDQALTRLESQ